MFSVAIFNIIIKVKKNILYQSLAKIKIESGITDGLAMYTACQSSHSENNLSKNIVDKNKWRYYLTNRVEKYRVERKHVYLLLLRGD